jgi:hypothetical protein
MKNQTLVTFIATLISVNAPIYEALEFGNVWHNIELLNNCH